MVKKVTLPHDLVEDFTKFPSEVQGWITKYGITPGESEVYSIGYSPSLHRVVLPVYNEGELLGFDAKCVDGTLEPKSLHYRNEGVNLQTAWVCDKEDPTRFVVVEDFLSGVKCNRHIATSVNFGTHLTNQKVKRLMRVFPNATQAFVFFDNDNPQVRKLQLEAKKTIEIVMGVPCSVVLSNKDPKEHSDEELKELFKL